MNTVSTSTNEAGEIIHRHYGNREIIRDCAAAEGLTNLTGLSLVYGRTHDAIQVASGTNHDVICTPLVFSGGVSLSNTNATKTERLTFVFTESSQIANGTLAATERFYYGPSNELVWFSLKGRLQYAEPGRMPAQSIRALSSPVQIRFIKTMTMMTTREAARASRENLGNAINH